jgi:hypothetical protein
MLKQIITIIIFALAFAFVESAVVVYLRHLLGSNFIPPLISKDQVLVITPGIAFLDPKMATLVIKDSVILKVEQLREGATLVMLATVAILAGNHWKNRLLFFFLAFGIWDIFYYIFLRLIIGWPKSLVDPDIFFLLPVPWVGPVVTPIAISVLSVIMSLWFLRKKRER